MNTKQSHRRNRGTWMKVRDGQSLRRWRERRGFSQRDLAYLVMKSQTTIYLIETGKLTSVSEGLGMRISKLLDVPLEDLFDLRESNVTPKKETGARTKKQGRTA